MYEKPVVLGSEDLSEGVFTASGGGATGGNTSTDCWTVGGKSSQTWNGSHNVFEMSAVHSTAVVHITDHVVFTYTFSAPIVNAYSEGSNECSFNGNVVTVTRFLHANGYNSGDNVTFKVWVQCADQATTEAVTLTGISYVCTHVMNVQGQND